MPDHPTGNQLGRPAADLAANNPGRYTGPPMDLANMRQNGVRCLLVHCLDCAHTASVNVDDQPHRLSVKSFEKRMPCSKCGGRKVDVRPDWKTSTELRIPNGR